MFISNDSECPIHPDENKSRKMTQTFVISAILRFMNTLETFNEFPRLKSQGVFSSSPNNQVRSVELEGNANVAQNVEDPCVDDMVADGDGKKGSFRCAFGLDEME